MSCGIVCKTSRKHGEPHRNNVKCALSQATAWTAHNDTQNRNVPQTSNNSRNEMLFRNRLGNNCKLRQIHYRWQRRREKVSTGEEVTPTAEKTKVGNLRRNEKWASRRREKMGDLLKAYAPETRAEWKGLFARSKQEIRTNTRETNLKFCQKSYLKNDEHRNEIMGEYQFKWNRARLWSARSFRPHLDEM